MTDPSPNTPSRPATTMRVEEAATVESLPGEGLFSAVGHTDAATLTPDPGVGHQFPTFLAVPERTTGSESGL